MSCFLFYEDYFCHEAAAALKLPMILHLTRRYRRTMNLHSINILLKHVQNFHFLISMNLSVESDTDLDEEEMNLILMLF